jgi:hypothetical protein
MNRTSYAFDCIAASGFAVMSPAIAYELRPDLWACAADCARTLTTRDKIPGTQRMTATFEGLGPVLVLARSLDQLAKRLEWIVGRAVIDLKPAEPEAPAAERPNLLHKQANAKEAERQAELRKLAAEDPPSHDCGRRREILSARRELGMAA